MEQNTAPKNVQDHEKLYKSCAPLTGSILYYIQQIPSITTSINAEHNETKKNKKIKKNLFSNL